MSACTPEAMARILGDMPQYRLNNAALEVSEGKNPQYCVRIYLDSIDSQGNPVRTRKRIYLGPISQGARAAEKKRRELLAKVNDTPGLLQNQIEFQQLIEIFTQDHIPSLGVSTQAKYRSHLENHIQPAWKDVPLYQVSTRKIQLWLKAKEEAGLPPYTLADLKNIMSAVFTMAKRYGMWTGENPVQGVKVPPARPVRKRTKLTTEQTRLLLEMLPGDVSLICETALFCLLRISEVLGLKWENVDLDEGWLYVEGRYWRGHYGKTKTEKGERGWPLGGLLEKFKALPQGEPGDYVFSVKTKYGVTRDDTVINRHFLKKLAKKMGVDYEGFGFHALRHEAVTRYAKHLTPAQLQKAAGHASERMTRHYTLIDREEREKAAQAMYDEVYEGRMQ